MFYFSCCWVKCICESDLLWWEQSAGAYLKWEIQCYFTNNINGPVKKTKTKHKTKHDQSTDTVYIKKYDIVNFSGPERCRADMWYNEMGFMKACACYILHFYMPQTSPFMFQLTSWH